MGHVDVNGVSHALVDGRPLLRRVSFRVDEGSVTALVGPNGSGKSTLLRMIAGDEQPDEGSIAVSGTLAVMRQFVGSVRDSTTVEQLLLSIAPAAIRDAAERLSDAESDLIEHDDERRQVAYAGALADWADIGGYAAEVGWDACTTAALGLSFDDARWRRVASLSGGEQKRLVLQDLLTSRAEVLLLDEPDNYLDVPGKEWLEERLAEVRKTVLVVSHDRELLRRTATRVVTLEPGPDGCQAWVHGGGMATYPEARAARMERLDELKRRFDEDLAKLKALVVEYRRKASYNPDFASKMRNAEHRLERFLAIGPPEEVPRPQRISMRLAGGRTGKRALVCKQLSLDGLTKPFDLEVLYGERVGVLGPNGTGKSHLLRLLAQDEDVAHSGQAVLGARVVPGYFVQSHDNPALAAGTLAEILSKRFDLSPERAVAALGRYELAGARRQTYDTLSGGQQARAQILMLELSGATMLLLDEPTDNLDVESAVALEAGLAGFEGTVLVVTHDRCLARTLDRFVFFGSDGLVRETDGPVWYE